MNEEQKELCLEAIELYSQYSIFANRILRLYGKSVSPSKEIVIQQLEIILKRDKK